MASSDHAADGTTRDAFQPDVDYADNDDAPSFRADTSSKHGRTLRSNAARKNGCPDLHPKSQSGQEGSKRSDSDTFRPARGRGDSERPNFNVQVGPNGYAWWYVDGLSDCGQHAVSVIGSIGSVFSPWYHWSGRKNPKNHVSISVATYGKGGQFSMTDRGQSALRQTASRLEIGPSCIRWNNDQLVIDICEVSSRPFISKVRGQIRLIPSAITKIEVPLTPDGAHIWRPFSPRARIDVDIERPGWTWSGEGYFDASFGSRALDEDFHCRTSSHYPTGNGATCFFDATRLDGSELAAGLSFDRNGTAHEIPLLPKLPLKRSLWALNRDTRGDAGTQALQVKNMLDLPFHSRSAVQTTFNGRVTTGVHETLDLTRFRSPLMKPMLAMRVPRRPKWDFS